MIRMMPAKIQRTHQPVFHCVPVSVPFDGEQTAHANSFKAPMCGLANLIAYLRTRPLAQREASLDR
jgi:hypothetical protein